MMAPPPRPQRKRRPAPKPPAQTQPMSTPTQDSSKICHSRTSSDSSGYHEASVLSESPDNHNGTVDTLPRRSKLPSVQPPMKGPSSASQGSHLSRSLSNLTAMGSSKVNSMHSTSTSSLASNGQKKKKAAPPPPTPAVKASTDEKQGQPVACEPSYTQKTASLDRYLRDRPDEAAVDRSATLPTKSMRMKEEIIPDARIVEHALTTKSLSLESDESYFLEELEIAAEPRLATLPDTRGSSPEQSSPVVSARSSKHTHPSPTVQQPDLDTVGSDTKETLKSHQSSTDLLDSANRSMDTRQQEEVSLKNGSIASEGRMTEPRISSDIIPPPDLSSSPASLTDVESVEDWQYQLPAPPSAFRDTNSPIPTEGETVALADTEVFKESTPSEAFSSNGTQRSSPLCESVITDKREPTTNYKTENTTNILENGITRLNQLYRTNGSEADIPDVETEANHGLRKERNDAERLKTSTMSSSNKVNSDDTSHNPPELKRSISTECSTLNKFFTITTYQRPKETDHIFEMDSLSDNQRIAMPEKKLFEEFKKPFPVRQQRHNSTSSVVSRTSSFKSNNNDSVTSPDRMTTFASVKRSTSYLSLGAACQPSSVLNDTSYSTRTKSVGNLSLDNELHQENVATRLERAQSHQNIVNGTEADHTDQLLSLQATVNLLPESQNRPLQSLHLVRTIQLSQSQNSLVNDSEGSTSENSNPLSIPKIVPKAVQPSEAAATTTTQQQQRPDTAWHSRQDNETNKRYTYSGPPAINFTTWTERPKIQVSIKSDTDYRTGSHQMTKPSCESEEQLSIKPKSTTSQTRESGSSSQKPTEQSQTIELKAKAEPLTMRIITHSAPVGFKKDHNSDQHKIFPVSKRDSQVAGYGSVQVSDPSRVPIVRSVELKKPLQQNFADNRSVNGGTRSSWKSLTNGCEDQSNMGCAKIDNAEDEVDNGRFIGVNSLAKMFSVGGVTLRNKSSINPRPTSAYDCLRNNEMEEIVVNGGSKSPENAMIRSTSITNVTAPNIQWNTLGRNNNADGARKFTSVVGINKGSLSSTSFREPTIQPGSSVVKVNGFTGTRQPMPVVKGFQFAGQGGSVQSVSVRVQPQTNPENSKIEIHKPEISANNKVSMESPVSFKVKIQQSTTSSTQKASWKTSEVLKPHAGISTSTVQIQNSVPTPPTPAPFLAGVVLKKSNQPRCKSLPPPSVNQRDQLMDAIRNFGKDNLKQVQSNQSTSTNVILKI